MHAKGVILGEATEILGEEHLSDREALTAMTDNINRKANRVKVT